MRHTSNFVANFLICWLGFLLYISLMISLRHMSNFVGNLLPLPFLYKVIGISIIHILNDNKNIFNNLLKKKKRYIYIYKYDYIWIYQLEYIISVSIEGYWILRYFTLGLLLFLLKNYWTNSTEAIKSGIKCWWQCSEETTEYLTLLLINQIFNSVC